jgi:hypothetical protein
MRSALRDVYDDVEAADRDEAQRFFSRVRLPSGVFKATEARRLDDLNRLAQPLLPDDRPLELMDVAVSTGITSLEWSEQLAKAGIEHRLLCGDSHVEGAWLRLAGLGDVLLDHDRREILFLELFGRAVDPRGSTRKSALALPVLRAIVWLGLRFRFPIRHVDLVDPAVRSSPAVTVVRDDIFMRRPELGGRFHVLRAANILNRAYFDDEQLRAGVASLQKRVRPGGLLIVCRTHEDGTNHGSIVRAAGEGWIVAARIGDGSEIEDLITGAVG